MDNFEMETVETLNQKLGAAEDHIDSLRQRVSELEDLWLPADQTLQCAICGWVDWPIEGQPEKHPDTCTLGYFEHNLNADRDQARKWAAAWKRAARGWKASARCWDESSQGVEEQRDAAEARARKAEARVEEMEQALLSGRGTLIVRNGDLYDHGWLTPDVAQLNAQSARNQALEEAAEIADGECADFIASLIRAFKDKGL
jgi:hypothetical protein